VVYKPNHLNQYTNVGGMIYGYDTNGNQTYDGSGWAYLYDRENRFVAAIMEDEGEIVRSITNTYDAFGRLIEERVKWSGNAYYTNRYVYDQQWRMLAWYYSDASMSVVLKYVYGPGIDEPVRQQTMGTSTNYYYYHSAALDTVTEMTSTNGTVLDRYSYDVYGTPTIRDGNGNLLSSSSCGNVLFFQGRVRDRYLGLYNFRNRYYSPTLGRFLQVDPVNVMGGDLNLYGFVGNDPINNTDPGGQTPLVTAAIGVGIGAGIGAIAAALNGGSLSDVGHGALRGAVAGGVAGLTLGLGGAALAGTLGGGVAGGALAGAVASGAGNLAAQGLDNATGQACGFNPYGFAVNVAVGGLFGGAAFRPFTAPTQPVTSWAPSGVTPNLNPGRWVMTGGPSPGNYLRSIAPVYRGYPYGNSVSAPLPGGSLAYPPGATGNLAGLWGQRVVTP
jgi:RHS repeat-associated protein